MLKGITQIYFDETNSGDCITGLRISGLSMPGLMFPGYQTINLTSLTADIYLHLITQLRFYKHDDYFETLLLHGLQVKING